MALPATAETREFANFADNGDGTTSRFVRVAGGIGGLLEGVEYDYISAAYPTATSEVYTYKLGGSGGVTQAVVTVNYTTASKQNLQSVSKA
jgi:hypothetical protein